MKVYITGVGGLIGSTVAEQAIKRGHRVWGSDCDNRGKWYGTKGSVEWRLRELAALGVNIYRTDYRERLGLVGGADVIVHCAGQASHDYSRAHVLTDFKTNALGTVELLETTRNLSPKATFVFMSTNKVYGDLVNNSEMKVVGERLVPQDWNLKRGVNEFWPMDNSIHTPFGVSKAAADLMVQEYRHCFGLKTVTFRCGCMTGPGGTAVELQGFLGYLVKCAVWGEPYTVYGWDGYQVRDNIDAEDVASAVFLYAENPKDGIYNIGGGPENSISVREAVSYLSATLGLDFPVTWNGPPRLGDHRWYITNTQCFESHYKTWTRKPIKEVLDDLVKAERARFYLNQVALSDEAGGTSPGGDEAGPGQAVAPKS